MYVFISSSPKIEIISIYAIYTLLLAATCILMLGYNIINVLIVPNVTKQSDEVKYRLPLLMSLKIVRDNSSPYFANDSNDMFQTFRIIFAWQVGAQNMAMKVQML